MATDKSGITDEVVAELNAEPGSGELPEGVKGPDPAQWGDDAAAEARPDTFEEHGTTTVVEQEVVVDDDGLPVRDENGNLQFVGVEYQVKLADPAQWGDAG